MSLGRTFSACARRAQTYKFTFSRRGPIQPFTAQSRAFLRSGVGSAAPSALLADQHDPLFAAGGRANLPTSILRLHPNLVEINRLVQYEMKTDRTVEEVFLKTQVAPFLVGELRPRQTLTIRFSKFS